jgi:2-polyprenyl-3-methyl-5-hydroxy-6-metoxy-1,4-benzoquinol methylase
MTQQPDPQKMQDTVRHIAGIMTSAHVSVLIVLGIRLGLYDAMKGAGPVTSDDLAAKTGLHERWLREWLRGQAAGGVLEYRGDDKFELTPEAAMLMADPTSMVYLAGNFDGLPRLMESVGPLQESFRTGLGFSWTDRDEEWVTGPEQIFGNWYRQQLVPVALPALDGVLEKLRDGAKVADVGCGTGIALIEMAKAFPASDFHGYEISTPAIERGERLHKKEADVTNVTFHNIESDPLPADASFDLITTFDCLHDMTQPGEAVKAIRGAIKPDGTWLIADINCAPTFEENMSNPMAPMLFALSVVSCLSSAMSEPGGAGLGNTGLPEPKMRELVEGAGFTRFRRLEIPHPVNAFYEARV